MELEKSFHWLHNCLKHTVQDWYIQKLYNANKDCLFYKKTFLLFLKDGKSVAI